MTSAPYALGVFRRPAAQAPGRGAGYGAEFTGLVVGDLVRDISGLGTMNELLDHWDCAQSRLDELAAGTMSTGSWTPLAGLDVRCPVRPGQILQCGANYRRHVVDIVMAERRADLSMTGHNSEVPEAEVTFLPTGPFLVPAKFVGDPADLRITLRHNGVVRQDEAVADMLFDLPAVLAYITGITELRPGDLVLTGSPAGNGVHWGVFLADGDLLEGEITGLGAQRNPIISKHASRQHVPAQEATR